MKNVYFQTLCTANFKELNIISAVWNNHYYKGSKRNRSQNLKIRNIM